MASATCGKTHTLALSTSAASVSLSDGTVLTVSQISANLSAPNKTALGSTICDVQELICQLADLLATNDPAKVADAINLLILILAGIGLL